ncbi:MAG TPA: LysR family transcriptional regulator [Nakamurella sp.]
MDFRQLEYFRAVVDAGSVSQAAKNLDMTQPPVSLAVAKLERELGVRLLERTAQGVRPTNAGLYLLRNGGRLLADRDRIAGTLSQMGEGVVGDLRIGVEPMVINEIVADVLADFLRTWPPRCALWAPSPTRRGAGVPHPASRSRSATRPSAARWPAGP